MNYYERHLGDYAKDTAHLSMLEHGAYGLLLDRYYGTEAGIPASQAHRVARARTKEERQAVDDVLSEFFSLVDGVWINGRADEEIAKANVKINAAKENGKKGGRPKKTSAGYEKETQQKPSGLSVGSEIETESKAHQTPDTSYSDTNVSGSDAAKSPDEMTKQELWAAGKSLLETAGLPKAQCGSFVGKLVKDYGDAIVVDAVRAAVFAQPADPVEYMKATCQHAFGQRQAQTKKPAAEDFSNRDYGTGGKL